MKRNLYSLYFLVLAAFSLSSCDNGNADTVVMDSPPSIKIVNPGSFVLEGNTFNLVVEFTDGVAELSRSPLASAAFSIFKSDSTPLATPVTGTFTVSGVTTTTNQPFTTALAPGKYFFNVSATDTKGGTTKTYKKFEVIADFASVGIIGSATPGGWDSDTDMTRDSGNPAIWVINSIVLTNGEAKFRANDAWTVNWGGNTFPNGTGTQDGPNIPVVAGTYKVTINITNGAYTFVK